MIRNILQRLKQPFPTKSSVKSTVLGQAYVAVFIAGFLFVFKPFGMGNAPNPFLLSVAFGLISLIFSVSFELFCRFVIRIKTDLPSWTLWKWLIQSFLMVSWIAFGNHLLQSILFWGHVGNLERWLQIWQATLTLGVLPIFVSGLIIQMRAVDDNVRQAEQIDFYRQGEAPQANQDPVLEFTLNSNESLKILASNLTFVEAMQNYVLVHSRVHEQESRHMIRNTISNTLQQCRDLGATNIIRCHRSYLVNLEAIEAVQGNAQGLKLTLSQPCNALVPVSRSYISEFKAALEVVICPSSASRT